MTSPAARARASAHASHRNERLYAEMATLADERSRRRFLLRHPGLVRAETVARLSEMVPQRIRIDVKEALALAESAELIARKLRLAEPLARSLRAKGNALYALDDHEGAVRLHDEAVRLFARARRPTEVGRTLSTCCSRTA